MTELPTSSSEEPQNPSRRDFLKKAVVISAAAALPSLGGCVRMENGAPVPSPFHLENEVAEGALDKIPSSSFSGFGKGAKEDTYTLVKAEIDKQNISALKERLKPLAQDTDNAPVVAKALAYTLSSAPEKKAEIVTAVLEAVPYARNVTYITQDNPRENTMTVKSLAELAKDGYHRDYPKEKTGDVIMQDGKLAARINECISQLPDCSRTQGPSR